MKNNYIICKEHNKKSFIKLGFNLFCDLNDMVLNDTISVDTETTGLHARHDDVFCIQIGNGVDSNYIIVLYNDNYLFEEVIPYLENKTLIFHNALFDLGFCYKHNFYPSSVRDTMLASKIIYNGAEDPDNHFSPYRHDFGNVMKRELNVIYDKTDQKNIHLIKLSQHSTIEYSFNDVDKLIELHEVLSKKIDSGGFRETYDLHCNYVKALAYMEQCGLPISSESWKNKMNEDLIEATKWKKIIEEYIYDNLKEFADRQIDMFSEDKKILIIITSPIQMIKVFEALGIPTKDKDGKNSINESIISKSKHEFVKMWLKYQEANHRVTTFGDKIYQQIENERVYTNFNPMVDTARLSSRKGSINFLNFPSDSKTRSCFKCEENNVMIVCDYSAQETVVAADLSEDAAMTKSVLDGDDLHCAFARVLFPELKDLSDEEITNNHKDKRSAAKAPRFAFSYGGSAYTIHQNEGIPLDEAYKIESAFKELHEGLYTWGNKVFEKSIKDGYIESADGWKLQLPNFNTFLDYKEEVEKLTKDDWKKYKEGKMEVKQFYEEKEKGIVYSYINKKNVEFYKSKKTIVSKFFKLKSEYQRLCLNNPVQSRSAHQLKLATVLLFNWIVENNYINIIKICNAVHDELVIECPEELKEIAKTQVQKFMIEGGNYYLNNLEIKAEAHYGKSWYEAK